ncbi:MULTISPECIES: SH3 domain-containing protein [Acidaminococcus]|jgi:uncharacterized protein YgiM (DUF1202 family)|uniref:SH3 domain-containing protein n=1 Tax=Acidaminococcus TaxID=904 RepID=UPI00094EA450|nr:SH3 domain-containing protein [Acidaminococcus massiliensis]
MKKMGRIIAALCCLLGLTFPMDRKADAAAAGTIIGTEVRMRKGAGTDTEILGYFEDGEKVEVLKSNVNEGRKWYEVSRKDGTLGWVAGEYCRVQEGALIPSETRLQDRKGRITGTEVRMRSDPSQNGDVLDYFAKGEIVTILDAADGGGIHWTKVERENGDIGWVASDYCQEL